jgi:hypothetical protein
MAWPVALVVLLVLVAVQAGRLGISGLIVELAQQEVDRWVSTRKPQGMESVNRVAGYYSDSLGYVSDNPWALEGLAAMDLARMRLSVVPQEAVAHAEAARTHLRRALRQRPTSPFLWANLALAKLYLDEKDGEFFTALRHADELGPWEPRPQEIFLFVSLAAWDKLQAGQRRAAGLSIERGGVHNSLKMFDIVKSYGRFDLVCGRKGYDAVAGAACEKADLPASSKVPINRGQR